METSAKFRKAKYPANLKSKLQTPFKKALRFPKKLAIQKPARRTLRFNRVFVPQSSAEIKKDGLKDPPCACNKK